MDEMAKWKKVEEELTVSDALEYATSDLRSLADEMDEWRSNMEGTNLEYTDKYERVSECADTLEEQTDELEELESDLKELATSEHVNLDKTIKVVWSKPYSRYESRPTRLNHITAYLEAVKEELKEQKDRISEKIEESKDHEQTEEAEKLEEVVEQLEEYIDSLTNILGELESVEFPGMYG